MKVNSTEIKNLEPIKTIAISHIGDYAEIGTTFDKLAVWAGANNLFAANPKIIGVYHDDPTNTPTEKLRSEACVENISNLEPGEGMKHYTISGGKYFVMQVVVTMAECYNAWMKVYEVIEEKKYECDMRDHYELYVSCEGDLQDPNAPWIVDLCIPIK